MLLPAAAFCGTVSLTVSFATSDVSVGTQQGYDLPALSGCTGSTDAIGKPDLPAKALRIVIPGDASVGDVTVTPTGAVDLPGQFTVLPKQPPQPVGAGPIDPAVSPQLYLQAIISARGNVPGPAFVPPDPAAYASNLEYPNPAQGYGVSSGDLFGYRVVEFKLYPLVYVPAQKLLRLYTSLQITVTYTTGASTSRRPECQSAWAYGQVSGWLKTVVDNPSAVESMYTAPSPGGIPVDYLIITRSDLGSEFQRLADWKTTKGLRAEVKTLDQIDATYDGVDQAWRVRQCIDYYVHSRGTPYVLLGGDVDVVPARHAFIDGNWQAWQWGPTDLYYAGLDGTWNENGNAQFGEWNDECDTSPDVFVGRAPVDDVDECRLFVNKTIAYDGLSDPTFGHSALLMFAGAWCHTCDGQETGEAIYHDFLLPNGFNTLRLYPDDPSCVAGGGFLNHDNALSALINGWDIEAHCDHSDVYVIGTAARCTGTVLSRGDLNALPPWSVQPRNGVFFTLGCDPNAFDLECWCESLIKSPGGAVAVIGNSRTGYWDQLVQEYAFFQALFSSPGIATPRLGQAFVAAQLASYRRCVLNLLGDPELTIRTGPFTAGPGTAPKAASGDLAYYSHTIDDNKTPPSYGNGNGCPEQGETIEMFVTLKNNGGTTATNVRARIPIKPGDAGIEMLQPEAAFPDIAAGSTGQSLTPFVFHVNAVGQEPYYTEFTLLITSDQGSSQDSFTQLLCVSPIEYRSCVIDDDNTPPSQGNGDGLIDAGETIEMPVVLANAGSDPLTNVSARMTSQSTGITIIGDTAHWGTIDAGQSKQSTDAFVFSVDKSFTDESGVGFLLSVTCDQGEWFAQFNQGVRWPVLRYAASIIDDDDIPPSRGDDDGVVDPSETIELPLQVENGGTGPAYGVTATLSSENPRIIVHQNLESFGSSIAPAARVWNDPSPVFVFETTAEYEVSDQAVLTIQDSLGRTWTENIGFPPPVPPGIIHLTPGQMCMDLTWDPAARADSYNVYRRTDFTPPVRINPRPVRGATLYHDSGLQAGMRYYYKVTSLTSKGWESAPSPEASNATNPALHPGWPVKVQGTDGVGDSSPAVADIDGDGLKEVVVSDDNNKVYVYRHDGSLAPGWPKTIGGGGYNSPALADLEASGRLDIIVSGDLVYAWRPDGTDVPGWPQEAGPITSACPSGSPSVADLDCDGRPEVVVGRGNGRVYAWHADGTPVHGWPVQVAYQDVRSTPAIADLDLDGSPEVVVINRDDQWVTSLVYAFHADGRLVEGGPGVNSGWPQPISFVTFGSPVVGDIDGDMYPEILVGSFQNGEIPGYVYAFRGDGSKEPGQWPHQYTPGVWGLSVADLNGDGVLDVAVNGMDGSMFGLKGDGTALPEWSSKPVNPGLTAQPVVADLDSDGKCEVVDCTSGGPGGTDILRASGTWLGTPWVMQGGSNATAAIADLENNGKAEVVLGSFDGRVYVWDLPSQLDPSSAQWPMYQHDLRHTGYAGLAPCRPLAVGTIAVAKRLKDGAWVQLSGKVVSAGSDDLAGCCYVEEPDRTSGIQVRLATPGVVVTRGQIVRAEGVMGTVDGERVLTGSVVTVP